MIKYCQYISVGFCRYDTSSYQPVNIGMSIHQSSSFRKVWFALRANLGLPLLDQQIELESCSNPHGCGKSCTLEKKISLGFLVNDIIIGVGFVFF